MPFPTNASGPPGALAVLPVSDAAGGRRRADRRSRRAPGRPPDPARSGSGHRRADTSGWLLLAVAAIAVGVVEFLLPAGRWADLALLVTSVAVAAVLGGVERARRGGVRATVVLLAAGLVCGSAPGAVAALPDQVLGRIPLAAARDLLLPVLAPLGGLLLALALATTLRRHLSARGPGCLLDALAGTTAVALVGWVALARSAVAVGGRPAAVVALVALAQVFGIVALVGARSPSRVPLRLVLAAVGAGVATDVVWLLARTDGVAVPGVAGRPLSDVLDLAALLAVGAAATHPSAMHPAPERAAGRAAFDWRTPSPARIAGLAAAALTPAVVLVAGATRPTAVDVPAVAAATALLVLLVVVRLGAAVDVALRAAGEVQRLQTNFRHQATHDMLTDLPNRAQVMRDLGVALRRSRQSGQPVGVLFVDLDGFKKVNDSYGHRAGDEVLRQVAARIRATLPVEASAGRLGGDEFVVTIERFDPDRNGVDLAEALIAAVSAPMSLDIGTVGVGASIGMAVTRDGGTDVNRLLEEADTAAYRAKAGGRGRVEVFDDVVRQDITRHKTRQTAIANGLAAGEFVVYYQPVVDLTTGETTSYEALVRWRRAGHGLVGPDEFIPVAEATPLIRTLGRWVLEQAATDLAGWLAPGGAMAGTGVRVAVNISGRHLAGPHVVQDVTDVLASTGLDPRRLVIEITETVLLDDSRAIEHVEAIRALGVGVSIDDFGTGYTSIGQLGRLPVDTVKIDKSFVRAGDAANEDLVRLMVSAAHGFGLRVVAEGVEDAGQQELVRRVGCDYGQGYLWGRPMPADVAVRAWQRPGERAAAS